MTSKRPPTTAPADRRSKRAHGARCTGTRRPHASGIGSRTGVESYLEAQGVGLVDGERVREVLEELRLEAGLTASDGHPDGARVAHMLRSALVPVGEEEPQRHPAARHLIEDIDFRAPRGLDKDLVLSLADGRWVREHLSILIIGPAGIGKSWIACALAHSACRLGHSASYRRLPRLLTELAIARADGSYPKLLASLAKTEVLIIDDFGLAKLSAENRRDLLEITEDRYGIRSTVITSQLPVENWHDIIGDPTLADAILDRLVHSSYQLNLKGESMRKRRQPLTQTDHRDS